MSPNFRVSPQQMQVFLDIAEAGSIAAAAKKLGLTAPAVSKQLAMLENQLELGLIERTTRRMQLTPAGRIFKDYAAETLRLLSERESRYLSEMRGEPSGTLRVVAARPLAIQFLLPHLHEFTSRFPHITLDLELAERFPDIEQENIDLIFGMTMQGTAGLIQRSIGKTAYWLCAAPSYLERHGHPQQPDDLSEHYLIAHTMRRHPNRLTLRDHQEVAMRTVLRLNDTSAMRQAAYQGTGIVSLHHYMVEDMIRSGELIRLLPDYELPAVPVHLFYRKSGRILPALRHFIDFAVKICRIQL
ncbi:MAG: LysR family transcriptional regulator [Brucellaceae bacterium]|jgi:DNA-binding transcriptional LysR family regulator|nr:LysR family transcriptional regulator [Brucellaceae bacterium]